MVCRSLQYHLFLYIASHTLNLWISKLKLHLAVHAKGIKFHCRRLRRQGLYFNCGCTFSCLFAKSSTSQSLQTVANLALREPSFRLWFSVLQVFHRWQNKIKMSVSSAMTTVSLVLCSSYRNRRLNYQDISIACSINAVTNCLL